MHVSMRRLLVAMLCLSLTLLVGCGQRSLPVEKTYPAQGKVTIKGEPARFVIVNFEPVERGKGAPAHASTDAEGRFSLRTYSNDEPDGAVPGEYKITLEDFDPTRVGAVPEGEKPTKLPAEAKNPEITLVVKSGDNDNLDIDINP
jgi:hypothetical protein